MDRLRKLYSYFAGGSLLAGKAAWVLSGCLTTESGDYFVLVNVRAWLKLEGVRFGVRSMPIRACIH